MEMMKKKTIIYLAQCKIKRDLIYIGKTHQTNLEDRIKQHEDSALNRDSAPFHQALINYGLLNWEWTILEECEIDEEYKREKEYIEKYKATPIDLLNVTHGKTKEEKKQFINKQVIEKTKGNLILETKKSELGMLFLRQSGKIKPVINLKTKEIYQSVTKAAEKENIARQTIDKSCKTGKMTDDGSRYAYLDINDKAIITEGHSKTHFIGKGKPPKKVKNLINGKIYNSVNEVTEKYEISSSSIDGSARGKYQTLKNKWVFCYLDENGKEIITDNHKRGLEKIKNIDEIKYVAWHIDDNEMNKLFYFKSLDEICEKLNISGKSHIISVCKGKRAHVEKWRVANYDQETNSPILHDKHKLKPKKVIRKVICLNDKKVFNNSSEAGKYYKIISSQVNGCAAGKAKSVYCCKQRLRFAFLDDNGNPILTPKHKEPLAAKGEKRIQVLKTGKIYNSLAEYIRETGVPYKTAKKYAIDKSINLFGYEYVELD